MSSEPTVDLSELLGAVEASSPTQGVDTLATELSRMVGAAEVSFLIVDIAGGTLVRLARAARDGQAVREREPADIVTIADSAPGTALRTQLVQIVPSTDRDGVWVYAPVTERGEAVGVLELLLPYQPGPETVRYLAAAAHALAFVVIADRRYTDLYEWGSRSARLTLEAEIQRRLLPLSYTCEAGQFTLGVPDLRSRWAFDSFYRELDFLGRKLISPSATLSNSRNQPEPFRKRNPPREVPRLRRVLR